MRIVDIVSLFFFAAAFIYFYLENMLLLSPLWWWVMAVLILAALTARLRADWAKPLYQISAAVSLLFLAGVMGYFWGFMAESFRLHSYASPVSPLFPYFLTGFLLHLFFPRQQNRTPKAKSLRRDLINILVGGMIFGLTALVGGWLGVRSWHLGGHVDEITALAFSRDGKILATGSQDKTIKLWEVKSGRLLDTLSGHTGEVSSLAFSHDGKYLVSCGWGKDWTIKLWELPTGKLLWSKNTPGGGALFTAAFSEKGDLIAGGTQDDSVIILETKTGKLQQVIPEEDSVGFVAIHPNGKLLISGTLKNVSIWNLANGSKLKVINNYSPVAINGAGYIIAAGVGDSKDTLEELTGKLAIYNPVTGKMLASHTGTGHYPTDNTYARTLTRINPNWSLLAIGKPSSLPNKIVLWDIKKNRRLSTISSGLGFLQHLTFSPDGAYLAAGYYSQKSPFIWEVATGRSRQFDGAYTWRQWLPWYSPETGAPKKSGLLAEAAWQKP
jgi:WD40 repeat protein